MGTLKPLSGVIKLTLSIETPVIHVQGGFKVPMETGRNLEHTTERHQRGFKVPMETGILSYMVLYIIYIFKFKYKFIIKFIVDLIPIMTRFRRSILLYPLHAYLLLPSFFKSNFPNYSS